MMTTTRLGHLGYLKLTEERQVKYALDTIQSVLNNNSKSHEDITKLLEIKTICTLALNPRKYGCFFQIA